MAQLLVTVLYIFAAKGQFAGNASRVLGQGGSWGSSTPHGPTGPPRASTSRIAYRCASLVETHVRSDDTTTQVDEVGNLYICDKSNNRVVRFPAGAGVADSLWGWPTLLTLASPATAPPTSSSLNKPEAVALYDGGLFVCDGSNNRLVFYSSLSSTVASNVWGQPGFTTSACGTPTAISLCNPNMVVFSRAGSMMFVADQSTYDQFDIMTLVLTVDRQPPRCWVFPCRSHLLCSCHFRDWTA
jgi:hypothetical protein